MIKVFFDHIKGFGKITQDDFIYSDPKGIAVGTTYLDYLEEGWIEWQGYWYNLRSVRLNLKEYSPTKTVKKLSKLVTYSVTEVDNWLIDRLTPIYQQYVEEKNFQRDIDLNEFLGFKALVYYQDNIIIGATIFKTYCQKEKTAFVSYQFLWDYKTPTLSLGNVSQYFECEVAKYLGCDYIYLLGGYESSCLYKSTFKGFEFWTGQIWSKDLELYQTLCKRDDNIRTPK